MHKWTLITILLLFFAPTLEGGDTPEAKAPLFKIHLPSTEKETGKGEWKQKGTSKTISLTGQTISTNHLTRIKILFPRTRKPFYLWGREGEITSPITNHTEEAKHRSLPDLKSLREDRDWFVLHSSGKLSLRDLEEVDQKLKNSEGQLFTGNRSKGYLQRKITLRDQVQWRFFVAKVVPSSSKRPLQLDSVKHLFTLKILRVPFRLNLLVSSANGRRWKKTSPARKFSSLPGKVRLKMTMVRPRHIAVLGRITRRKRVWQIHPSPGKKSKILSRGSLQFFPPNGGFSLPKGKGRVYLAVFYGRKPLSLKKLKEWLARTDLSRLEEYLHRSFPTVAPPPPPADLYLIRLNDKKEK